MAVGGAVRRRLLDLDFDETHLSLEPVITSPLRPHIQGTFILLSLSPMSYLGFAIAKQSSCGTVLVCVFHVPHAMC